MQIELWSDVEDSSSAKLRGGYYTPVEVAGWLCKWAIRDRSDRVLEPSCGDGIFLAAAAARLKELGAVNRDLSAGLRGIELAGVEAEKSAKRLGRLGQDIVCSADFFSWIDQNPLELFDCVVGNPPFVRYQNFPEPSRSRAMALIETAGLKANRLMNTWVPFVVGAVGKLVPGGRLGFVLPAELLQVSYAAQLRSFLVSRFKKIDLWACNELIFENAEQEVVLLLADGYLETTSNCEIDFKEVSTLDELLQSVPARKATAAAKVVEHEKEKWLKYLLEAPEIGLMRELRDRDSIGTLRDHGQVDVGVVTGNNDFFVLSRDVVDKYRLQEYTTPIAGRAVHLQGAAFTEEDWRELARKGQRVHLLNIPKSATANLPRLLAQYIAGGEEKRVHAGYKCSIRTPWYSVPSVWAPDCFFFRQIYDFPRVVLNQVGAVSTDTIHRFRCSKDARSALTNLYTHLTAASAEIEGRSYGGGVLELEPTEAERVLMPKRLQRGLDADELDGLIRRGRLTEVLTTHDRLILRDGLGLSASDVVKLRRIWEKLRNRRLSRRKK